MKKRILYFFLLGIGANYVIAQSNFSPEKILSSSQNDTTKLSLLVTASEQCEEPVMLSYTQPAVRLADKLLNEGRYKKYRNRILYLKGLALNNSGFALDSSGDLDSALASYNKALILFNEIKDANNAANVTNNIAGIEVQKGDVGKAIESYKECIRIQEAVGNIAGTAAAYNNLAGVFRKQGDIPKALEYYSKSLRLLESELPHVTDKRELKQFKQGIATLLTNVGLIYVKQGDKLKSIEYYNRSLKLYEEINDQSGIATAFFNLGYTYRGLGDIKKSLMYYSKSLEIRERIGDKEGIAYSLHNIGYVYMLQKAYSKSLEYHFKALQLRRSIGNKMDVVYSYTSIADLFLKEKKYDQASLYADSSYSFAHSLGFPESLQNSESVLFRIDSAKGNYSGAFDHYKRYIMFRDSIRNEGTRKAAIKNQLSYEYEKKEAVLKEQQEKERLLAGEKALFQKIIIGAVLLILLFVVIFAVYVFRSLKTTRLQKHIIEEKQKEILDSINYAQRIQRSLLPTEKYVGKSLQRLKEQK